MEFSEKKTIKRNGSTEVPTECRQMLYLNLKKKKTGKEESSVFTLKITIFIKYRYKKSG